MPSLPKHKLVRIASSAAVTTIPTSVYRMVLVPAGATATAKLTNDADGSGTAVVSTQALASGNSDIHDFESLGPVYFSTTCYATVAGTGAVLYVWYD